MRARESTHNYTSQNLHFFIGEVEAIGTVLKMIITGSHKGFSDVEHIQRQS